VIGNTESRTILENLVVDNVILAVVAAETVGARS